MCWLLWAGSPSLVACCLLLALAPPVPYPAIQLLRANPLPALPCLPCPALPPCLPPSPLPPSRQVIGTSIALLLLCRGAVPLWGGVLLAAAAAYTLLFLERLGVRYLEVVFELLIAGARVLCRCACAMHALVLGVVWCGVVWCVCVCVCVCVRWGVR